MGRGDDIRMVGQTEIIVGAKINDALRLSVVSNAGAGIRTGEQFRLIQFDCPRAGLHPGGETWRGLQWVAAFAREKIAQTKFCRVLVHSLWQIGRLWRRSISGQQFYEIPPMEQVFSSASSGAQACAHGSLTVSSFSGGRILRCKIVPSNVHPGLPTRKWARRIARTIVAGSLKNIPKRQRTI